MEEIAIESYDVNSKMVDDGFTSSSMGEINYDDKAQNNVSNEGLIIGITIAICIILGIVLGIVISKKTVK